MNIEQVTRMFSENLERLWAAWPYKLILGGIFAVLGKHMAVFTAFALIVGIDLFAKLIAISSQRLAKNAETKPSMIAAIKGIPAAHRDGVINSYAMRTRFAEKIGVYLILVVAGALVDYAVGRSEFAQLIIAYLASSELLSIVENLDDAGVSAVRDLAALVKRKRGA